MITGVNSITIDVAFVVLDANAAHLHKSVCVRERFGQARRWSEPLPADTLHAQIRKSDHSNFSLYALSLVSFVVPFTFVYFL
jgi:hypothetical protein